MDNDDGDDDDKNFADVDADDDKKSLGKPVQDTPKKAKIAREILLCLFEICQGARARPEFLMPSHSSDWLSFLLFSVFIVVS